MAKPQNQAIDSDELVDQSGSESDRNKFPYLQLDLNADPELVAEKMIEGANIPGIRQPITVHSSNLPKGWEKCVIQHPRAGGWNRWNVSFTNFSDEIKYHKMDSLVPIRSA